MDGRFLPVVAGDDAAGQDGLGDGARAVGDGQGGGLNCLLVEQSSLLPRLL